MLLLELTEVHRVPRALQAIARRLQEKEMKEERKRQKQLESNFEEEYFEDHGGGNAAACFRLSDLTFSGKRHQMLQRISGPGAWKCSFAFATLLNGGYCVLGEGFQGSQSS